ncbi:MAG: hypothetical protein ABW192_04780 [Sphingobium sp.]
MSGKNRQGGTLLLTEIDAATQGNVEIFERNGQPVRSLKYSKPSFPR